MPDKEASKKDTALSKRGIKQDYEKIVSSEIWIYYSLELYNTFHKPKVKGYFCIVSEHHWFLMMSGFGSNMQNHIFNQISKVDNIEDLIESALNDLDCAGIVPINPHIESMLVEGISSSPSCEGYRN